MNIYECACKKEEFLKGITPCHFKCYCGKLIKTGELRCCLKKKCVCNKYISVINGPCHKKCLDCGNIVLINDKCVYHLICICGKLYHRTKQPCHKFCICNKLIKIDEKSCHVICELCLEIKKRYEDCKCKECGNINNIIDDE